MGSYLHIKRTIAFHRRQEIWLAEWLSAQEVSFCMELFKLAS
jgi:hypothetical protein